MIKKSFLERIHKDSIVRSSLTFDESGFYYEEMKIIFLCNDSVNKWSQIKYYFSIIGDFITDKTNVQFDSPYMVAISCDDVSIYTYPMFHMFRMNYGNFIVEGNIDNIESEFEKLHRDYLNGLNYLNLY